jgi:hypothetical protein
MTFAFMAITLVPINVAGRATPEELTNTPEQRISYQKESVFQRLTEQAAEKLMFLKGTAFRPYVNSLQ